MAAAKGFFSLLGDDEHPVITPKDLLLQHPIDDFANRVRRHLRERWYAAHPTQPEITADAFFLQRQRHQLLSQHMKWQRGRLDEPAVV